jgi:pilus assembly protein CpaE
MMSASLTNPRRLTMTAFTRSHKASEQVAAALAGIEVVSLTIEERTGGDMSLQFVNSHRPDILFVDVSGDEPAAIARVESLLRQKDVDMHVIASGADATMDTVRRLMRAGVADFVPQPISRSDLLTSIEAIANRIKGSASGSEGRVFAFLKSGGGVGATTLAVHAASAIPRAVGRPVHSAILDLDLQYGRVALYLDIVGKTSAADIIHSPERLDAVLFSTMMSHHKSGLDVLAAPSEMVPLEALEPDVAASIVDLARQQYEFVMLDLPHDWTAWTSAVIGKCDLLFLVLQANVGAVRQARRQIKALAQEGLSHVPLVVVLNRYRARLFHGQIRLKELQEALGRPVDFLIPNDFKLVYEALNRGASLSEIRRWSKIERRIRDMVTGALARVPGDSALAAGQGYSHEIRSAG